MSAGEGSGWDIDGLLWPESTGGTRGEIAGEGWCSRRTRRRMRGEGRGRLTEAGSPGESRGADRAAGWP